MAEIGRAARGRAPDGVGAPLTRGRVCTVKRRAVPGGDAEVPHFFDQIDKGILFFLSHKSSGDVGAAM